MPSENSTHESHPTTMRAVRHHPVVVVACLVVGALLGFLFAASMPPKYTSTATVLVNPSVGNPFVPSPSSVRQDELTSLETEAQVAQSAEVLGAVTAKYPSVSRNALDRNLRVVVPPNTQTLIISYTAGDARQAQTITNAVADEYLANRERRFTEVTAAQVARLSAQTAQVVQDLRAASNAAQSGPAGKQAFQNQLATALRNQLVNLRAQRTALENSDVPAGSVITPASRPHNGTGLMAMAAPVGGAVAGLMLGCVIALLLERLAGSIRTAREVEELGLPIAAAVPTSRLHRPRRGGDAEGFDNAIRRLRASILALDERPDLITVAPPGSQPPEPEVSEAVAESFAKAGHRVVLVRTHDEPRPARGLVVEDGLAQALLYERLDVTELLEPSREPLLCVLPSGGFDAQSREFLTADRLRSVLTPLVEAGNLVVIESRGLATVEGEAMAGAADLCLVAVTTRRTRTAAVAALVRELAAKGTPAAALVVGRRDAGRRSVLDPVDSSRPGSRSRGKRGSVVFHNPPTHTKR